MIFDNTPRPQYMHLFIILLDTKRELKLKPPFQQRNHEKDCLGLYPFLRHA